jgi:hypothetical protein
MPLADQCACPDCCGGVQIRAYSMDHVETHVDENWAKANHVVQLLATMLARPEGSYVDAVHTLLPGGLHYVHVISLLRASNNVNFKEEPWQTSVTNNRGIVYHIWLYHFFGGADADLLVPPARAVTADLTKVSTNLRITSQRFRMTYEREVARLKKSRGSDDEVRRYRATPMPLSMLRKKQPRCRVVSPAASSLAPAATAELAPSTASLAPRQRSAVRSDDFDWSGELEHDRSRWGSTKRRRADIKMADSLAPPCAACPECKCRRFACVRVRVQLCPHGRYPRI